MSGSFHYGTSTSDMHYRRPSLSRTWAFLLRQPTHRIVLYTCIVFFAFYALLHASSPSRPSFGWGIAKDQDQDQVLEWPAHYSPLVNVNDHVWANRAEQVKYAFMHAYRGYEEFAAPSDELKPISRQGTNNMNGWGLTVFDSLDTMLLMDLTDEYERGLSIVKQANFSVSTNGYVPFFETTIRYLGGLLSAYALSPQDTVLLDRAVDLVDKLDPVFKSVTGMAYFGINPSTGKYKGPVNGILAEIASLQLEYTYLAKLTGRKEHFDRANTVMDVFAKADLRDTGGMLPVLWDIDKGVPANSHVSVGAQADSAHEYLLKLYLLTGKKDKKSLEMYIRTTTHILTNLLYLSPERHLLYVTDTRTSTYKSKGVASHTFEHLSCFLPGLLALGAHTLPLDDLGSLGIDLSSIGSEDMFGHAGKAYTLLQSYSLKKLHLWAAEGLAQTCWLTYADQPTGLGPDEMVMRTITKEGRSKKVWDGTSYWAQSDSYLWFDAVERWRKSGSKGEVPGLKEKKPVIYTEAQRTGKKKAHGRDYLVRKSGYLLRPETVESLFLLWKVTGDWKWRARGWAIFEAIQNETKTSCGYANLRFVERSPGVKSDAMPSYFLAETLKYLYLMFKDEELIPLDRWVFNTEAHPFPIFEWTDAEREKFGIKI